MRRGYDDYENFRRAGSAGDFAKAAGLDQLPWYRKTVEHPAYDSFWSDQALDKTMAAQPLTVPTMWIQGIWDQEDMWGAIHSYLAVEPKDTANTMNYLVMGPWRHSGVNYDGTTLGPLKFDGDTALQFRRDVLKPFFDQYLKEGAPKADDAAGLHLQHRRKPLGSAAEAGRWPARRAVRQRRNRSTLRRTPACRSRHRPAAMAMAPLVMTSTSQIPQSPCPVPAAARALRRRRAVAPMAPYRPALGGRSAGRAGLHDAGTHRAAPRQRRTAREPGGVDERDRQRLGGEIDRRLSRRGAEPAGDGRVPAVDSDGHLPRALSRKLRRRRSPSRRTRHFPTGSSCRR